MPDPCERELSRPSRPSVPSFLSRPLGASVEPSFSGDSQSSFGTQTQGVCITPFSRVFLCSVSLQGGRRYLGPRVRRRRGYAPDMHVLETKRIVRQLRTPVVAIARIRLPLVRIVVRRRRICRRNLWTPARMRDPRGDPCLTSLGNGSTKHRIELPSS